MNGPHQSTVSRLLLEYGAGSNSAFDEVVQIVYEELRDLARGQRQRWHGDDTLNTTALVHEAYLKLADQADPQWVSRTHFRRVVAKAMRQILIDYSLAQRTTKRGGERLRVSFDELRATGSSGEFSSQDAEALIALDESLNRLSKLDERQSQVVECRFFGGMTIPETAETLGISTATVERDWAIAKAWLYRDMQQTPGL